MALQSTGYLINDTEHGGWLDGFWGWAGDRVTGVIDDYTSRWLDVQFPESVAPWNTDSPISNVTTEAGSVQQGFMDNKDNQKLLMIAGAAIAVLLLLK